MTTGSLSFPTGQALLDWLLATNQPFNVGKVSHKERSKNNLRKFIPGLGKRWDSIDQLSQIVIETFLTRFRYHA